MIQLPLNHKTIFLFDHSNYFANYCSQTFEFDVATKIKSSSSSSQSQKLEPLNKTLWTCCVEAAIEYSRIIYDLFPENKLIRLLISKFDCPLNSWNESEQGLDHLMNIMASVLPPSAQARPLYEGEEFINLCKALNIAVNSIAQLTELQQNLLNEAETKKLSNKQISNSGRIILFTTAKNKHFDQIQEFLNKAIEECNKNIEQFMKNEKT